MDKSRSRLRAEHQRAPECGQKQVDSLRKTRSKGRKQRGQWTEKHGLGVGHLGPVRWVPCPECFKETFRSVCSAD